MVGRLGLFGDVGSVVDVEAVGGLGLLVFLKRNKEGSRYIFIY